MKLFLDTNVLLEFLCGRAKAVEVRDLLDAIEDEKHQAYISSSAFCTIAYYVELTLKDNGFHKPEKTVKLREILNSVLEIVTVLDTNHVDTCTATNNLHFDDIEDSMQYQCAIKGSCDCLITFNTKDYKNVEQSTISVLTPSKFLNK